MPGADTALPEDLLGLVTDVWSHYDVAWDEGLRRRAGGRPEAGHLLAPTDVVFQGTDPTEE
ncbi:hypothetical protein [Streptomyces sp. NPDC055992]|uniref:hypothetical protein n=1 Tax=Streptomyces sp. NPDC055992 TaxID=3345673 RepID=UPI0035DB7139